MATKASGTGTASNITGRVRLGELLVKAGVITDAQLRTALQEQKQWGGKLGDILVRMQVLSEDVFVRALSKQLGLPRADLTQPIPNEALARVPAEIAEEYEIVPLGLQDDGKTLSVATADPLNVTALDTVRAVAGLRIQAHVAGASAVRAAIARMYQGERDAAPMVFVNNAEDQPVVAGNQPPRGAQRTNTSPTMPAVPALRQNGPPSSPPSYPTPAYGVPAVYGTQLQAPLPSAPNGTQLQAPLGGAAPYAQMPTPVPGSMTVPLAAHGMPGHGMPAHAPHPGAPAMTMPLGAAGGWAPEDGRMSSLEESQRREVAALKALVELLVQKGVISLDEYLARLKR